MRHTSKWRAEVETPGVVGGGICFGLIGTRCRELVFHSSPWGAPVSQEHGLPNRIWAGMRWSVLALASALGTRACPSRCGAAACGVGSASANSDSGAAASAPPQNTKRVNHELSALLKFGDHQARLIVQPITLSMGVAWRSSSVPLSTLSSANTNQPQRWACDDRPAIHPCISWLGAWSSGMIFASHWLVDAPCERSPVRSRVYPSLLLDLPMSLFHRCPLTQLP